MVAAFWTPRRYSDGQQPPGGQWCLSAPCGFGAVGPHGGPAAVREFAGIAVRLATERLAAFGCDGSIKTDGACVGYAQSAAGARRAKAVVPKRPTIGAARSQLGSVALKGASIASFSHSKQNQIGLLSTCIGPTCNQFCNISSQQSRTSAAHSCTWYDRILCSLILRSKIEGRCRESVRPCTTAETPDAYS